ncbi:MAG TPA: hypothetical protein VMZ92_03210 [Planctomycetota bacterium]|nr:hypothetical protein [Planctomycetota bacterium]
MGYPTSNPTVVSTLQKGKSPAQLVREMCDGDIHSQFADLCKLIPRTQTITIKSSGNTVFVPTYPGTPTMVVLGTKTASATRMLGTSCRITNKTAAGITLVHGTGKNCTAYATVFYN